MIDSNTEILVRNTTCALFMLDGELSNWIKKNPFNKSGNELEFILQVESNHNNNVYITLDYSDESYTDNINAVLISKNLTPKEIDYTKTFQPLTHKSFLNKGIKVAIKERLRFSKLSNSLKETIALTMHNLVERMILSETITSSKLGFTKTSVVVYMQYNNGVVVKVEYNVNEIESFMEKLSNHKLNNVRVSFRNAFNGENQCNA